MKSYLGANVSPRIFEKGIIYYILNDAVLAKRYLNVYFKSYKDTIIRRGFHLLLQGEYWKADTLFKNYLSIRKYSVMAIIGAALAREKINETDTVEYLKIAKRLNPRYPLTYACLAVKYLEKKKYGLAKANIYSALKYARIPDYKLIYVKLYITLKDFNTAFNTLNKIKNEMDNNFYFSFYLAKTAFALNKINRVRENINEAIRLTPGFLEAKVMLAQYYCKVNNLRKANMILRDIKIKKTNFNYLKTYAQLLLRLKDRRCKDFLLKAYSERKWDKDINRLLGEYYLWQQKDDMVQNCINRAVLSGNQISELKEIFPGKYEYPVYKFLKFFNVIHLKWLNKQTLAAIVKKHNTDSDYLYIIDNEKIKVTDTFKLTGKFKQLFVSDSGNNMIISLLRYNYTYLYSVTKRRNRYLIKKVNRNPLKIETVFVEFDERKNIAYITDNRIVNSIFESPFTVRLDLGVKKPYYPLYPFRIYSYNFNTLKYQRIKKYVDIEEINTSSVRKYYTIVEAYNFNSDIKSLIQRGEKLEIDSTDEIRISFSRDYTSFIIYSSDLDVPFYAIIYDTSDSSIISVHSKMISGQSKYIPVQLVDFWPERNEILFLIKDKRGNSLVKFNYKTYLSYLIASRYLSSFYNPSQNAIYVIKQRSYMGLYPETEVIVLTLDQLYKTIYKTNKDVERFVFHNDYKVYFTTFNGGLVKIDLLDEAKDYKYIRPSLDGSVYDRLEGTTRSAAFINGKIFFID